MRDADEPYPPFRWVTRYDLIGLGFAAIVVVLLIVAGAPWYWIVLAGGLVTNVTSAALRKRAGVRMPTIWQRLDRKRRS
jgi:hypothetical protein